MDSRPKERHLQHSKNCVLSPFLFGRYLNYCEKVTLLFMYFLIYTLDHGTIHVCKYDTANIKYQIQKEIKTPTSSEQACTKVVFVLKLISAISELDIGSAF